MQKVIVFIIIISVAGFAGVTYVLQSDRPSDKKMQTTKPSEKLIANEKREQIVSNPDAQIALLTKKIEYLDNKVDKLAQALQLAQLSPQLENDNSDYPMEDQNVEADEYIAAERGEPDDYHAELEQRFAAETTDLAWVNRMEIAFQTSINRLSDFGLQNTQMIHYECRATLCNAGLELGKGENPQFLATALTMPEVVRINIVSTTSDDGSPISRVYFFREGYTSKYPGQSKIEPVVASRYSERY